MSSKFTVLKVEDFVFHIREIVDETKNGGSLLLGLLMDIIKLLQRYALFTQGNVF